MTWLKLAPYIITVVVIGLVVNWIYDSGSKHAASVVQAEWDIAKEAARKAEDLKKAEYDKKEEDHRNEVRELTHNLAEADKQYQVSLAANRADYVRRLQFSTDRAAIYQRQAEGGAIECRNLASYATELDRTIEEGRSLVFELRETVGLRDKQNQQLGQQIKSDRKLLN